MCRCNEGEISSRSVLKGTFWQEECSEAQVGPLFPRWWLWQGGSSAEAREGREGRKPWEWVAYQGGRESRDFWHWEALKRRADVQGGFLGDFSVDSAVSSLPPLPAVSFKENMADMENGKDLVWLGSESFRATLGITVEVKQVACVAGDHITVLLPVPFA